MDKKTIRDISLSGKRVLVRVDFNVPLEDGKVADDMRIVGAVPTLKAILAQKPKALILMSHLGRPKGERKPEFSLKPVVPVLSGLLGVDVAFADDCVGEVAEKAVAALPEGGVLLLENTRYHAGETKNDQDMAKQLAKLGDVYVNDAFGTAHRAHASSEGVAHILPAVAGLLMEKEIEFLSNAVENPKRPFVAILGGKKVSDKIGVIENLLTKADKILIGGGMANTFFKAQGIAVGASFVEEEALDTAKQLLEKGSTKLVLPVDAVVADAFEADAASKTVKRFGKELDNAMTIVWNGPMGVFEFEPFAAGTFAIVNMTVARTGAGAVTIIGGGDSAAAVRKAGMAEKMTHVSTGGGASLELLEGKILPGLAALNDK